MRAILLRRTPLVADAARIAEPSLSTPHPSRSVGPASMAGGSAGSAIAHQHAAAVQRLEHQPARRRA
jgi:hypothetical protein